MLITIKNKDTLIIDDFIFKCAIGKNNVKKNKKEGDKATPLGLFSIGKLYYRADRVKKPSTKIKTKIITKNMGWCDDPKDKFYNQEIKINNSLKYEKLFRKDHLYDFFIEVDYNHKKKPFKGSAIFIHLTKNYKPTKGCIALKEKDFLILLKLVTKKTYLNII